jgi:hypothetical protein
MKPGDTVRCLHPEGGALIRGKSYTVVSSEDDWIVILNETGLATRYPSVRFQTEAPRSQEPAPRSSGGAQLSILRRPS